MCLVVYVIITVLLLLSHESHSTDCNDDYCFNKGCLCSLDNSKYKSPISTDVYCYSIQCKPPPASSGYIKVLIRDSVGLPAICQYGVVSNFTSYVTNCQPIIASLLAKQILDKSNFICVGSIYETFCQQFGIQSSDSSKDQVDSVDASIEGSAPFIVSNDAILDVITIPTDIKYHVIQSVKRNTFNVIQSGYAKIYQQDMTYHSIPAIKFERVRLECKTDWIWEQKSYKQSYNVDPSICEKWYFGALKKDYSVNKHKYKYPDIPVYKLKSESKSYYCEYTLDRHITKNQYNCIYIYGIVRISPYGGSPESTLGAIDDAKQESGRYEIGGIRIIRWSGQQVKNIDSALPKSKTDHVNFICVSNKPYAQFASGSLFNLNNYIIMNVPGIGKQLGFHISIARFIAIPVTLTRLKSIIRSCESTQRHQTRNKRSVTPGSIIDFKEVNTNRRYIDKLSAKYYKKASHQAYNSRSSTYSGRQEARNQGHIRIPEFENQARISDFHYKSVERGYEDIEQLSSLTPNTVHTHATRSDGIKKLSFNHTSKHSSRQQDRAEEKRVYTHITNKKFNNSLGLMKHITSRQDSDMPISINMRSSAAYLSIVLKHSPVSNRNRELAPELYSTNSLDDTSSSQMYQSKESIRKNSTYGQERSKKKRAKRSSDAQVKELAEQVETLKKSLKSLFQIVNDVLTQVQRNSIQSILNSIIIFSSSPDEYLRITTSQSIYHTQKISNSVIVRKKIEVVAIGIHLRYANMSTPLVTFKINCSTSAKSYLYVRSFFDTSSNRTFLCTESTFVGFLNPHTNEIYPSPIGSDPRFPKDVYLSVGNTLYVSSVNKVPRRIKPINIVNIYHMIASTEDSYSVSVNVGNFTTTFDPDQFMSPDRSFDYYNSLRKDIGQDENDSDLSKYRHSSISFDSSASGVFEGIFDFSKNAFDKFSDFTGLNWWKQLIPNPRSWSLSEKLIVATIVVIVLIVGLYIVKEIWTNRDTEAEIAAA